MQFAIDRRRRLLIAWVTAVLLVSATVYSGFLIWLAVGPDDVGRFETTLAMSVSSQLTAGPAGLYGPYTGSNRLVLIHAPLYYRLAAVVAWLFVGLNVSPLDASFIAGRLISIAATLFCLVTAYRLARLGGASARAGVWAASLIAAAPIPGLLAVMVRPDMLAVALQTSGIFLVSRSMVNHFDRRADLLFAYLSFALAFCVKQSSVIALVLSSVLLIMVGIKRRELRRVVVVAHLAAMAAVSIYMGVEEVLTSGNMSLCVFILPGGPFRQINRASWAHVVEVLVTIVKKLGGLLAMILGCAIGLRGASRGSKVDLLIAIYLVAELCCLIPLCLNNKGSADNYVLQAVVLGSILVGRGTQRILDDAELPLWRLAVLAIAPVLLLGRDVQFVRLATMSRRAEDAVVAAIRSKPELSSATAKQIYFVDRLDLNRRYGNRELIHDEWLYGAFEDVGKAEARDQWLRRSLRSGEVRLIVMPDESDRVPGVVQTIPELGFARVERQRDYVIWKRR